MKREIIDAHIHLDMYEDQDQQGILQDLERENVQALISVSNHVDSAKRNLDLAKRDSRVKPAVGYHPEQSLPSQDEVESLLKMLKEQKDQIVAVGEVGLPYYLRQEHSQIDLAPYKELLDKFVKLAIQLDLPIVLHAIYEDADMVCDLLEKYDVQKAHFHWFKGFAKTVERMIQNGYFISFTPDCLYEEEIHHLIKQYPIEQIMVETDGPWPFEGKFKGKVTHPWMIHDSVKKIADIKSLDVDEVHQILLDNTKRFYNI